MFAPSLSQLNLTRIALLNYASSETAVKCRTHSFISMVETAALFIVLLPARGAECVCRSAVSRKILFGNVVLACPGRRDSTNLTCKQQKFQYTFKIDLRIRGVYAGQYEQSPARLYWVQTLFLARQAHHSTYPDITARLLWQNRELSHWWLGDLPERNLAYSRMSFYKHKPAFGGAICTQLVCTSAWLNSQKFV